MRMSDLAIPFDVVVAGVRRQPYAALPSRFRRPELAALQLRSSPVPSRSELGRWWRHACGRSPRSSTCGWSSRSSSPATIPALDFDVVDAASFSSAIPGVLHHETSDPRMIPTPRRLVRRTQISRRSSTAARPAMCPSSWRGSGSATASSAPAMRATWPLTASIRNGIRDTCGWRRSCRRSSCRCCVICPTPTISFDSSPPCRRSTWHPPTSAIERACRWGRESVDKAIPVTSALLEPTWWEGDAPAAPASGARGTREVGGVFDELGDGGDSVAERSLLQLAQPSPDLKPRRAPTTMTSWLTRSGAPTTTPARRLRYPAPQIRSR